MIRETAYSDRRRSRNAVIVDKNGPCLKRRRSVGCGYRRHGWSVDGSRYIDAAGSLQCPRDDFAILPVAKNIGGVHQRQLDRLRCPVGMRRLDQRDGSGHPRRSHRRAVQPGILAAQKRRVHRDTGRRHLRLEVKVLGGTHGAEVCKRPQVTPCPKPDDKPPRRQHLEVQSCVLGDANAGDIVLGLVASRYPERHRNDSRTVVVDDDTGSSRRLRIQDFVAEVDPTGPDRAPLDKCDLARDVHSSEIRLRAIPGIHDAVHGAFLERWSDVGITTHDVVQPRSGRRYNLHYWIRAVVGGGYRDGIQRCRRRTQGPVGLGVTWAGVARRCDDYDTRLDRVVDRLVLGCIGGSPRRTQGQVDHCAVVLHGTVKCRNDVPISSSSSLVTENLVGIELRLWRDTLHLTVRGGNACNVCTVALNVHGVAVLVGEVVSSHHLCIGKFRSAKVRMHVVDTCVDDANGRTGSVKFLPPRRCAVPQRLIHSHGGICIIVQDLHLLGFVDKRDMVRPRNRCEVIPRNVQCETIEGHAQSLLDRIPDTLCRQRQQKYILLLRDLCFRCVRGHGVQPPFRSCILDSTDQRKTLHADDDVLW